MLENRAGADPAAAAVPAENEPQAVSEDPGPGSPSRVRRCLTLGWRFFLGTLFCHSFLGGVLVVGWTYRVVQRSVVKRWWKAGSGAGEPVPYAEFQDAGPQTQSPNWVLRQGGWSALRRDLKAAGGTWSRVRICLMAPVGSLGINFRLGLQGLLTTWVLTLPAGVLWSFAWYSGWDNSFNKGYEQASIGATTGLLGVALFLAALFYLPLAQARQAATGSWRSFFQFGLIWRLARRRWGACLVLAGLYSLASLPVMLLKTLPAFFSVSNPATLEMTDAELLEWVNGYFFWASAFGFVVFVLLRLAAARIYAGALPEALRLGEVTAHQLTPFEERVLRRVRLGSQEPKPPPPSWAWWLRKAARPVTRTLGLALAAAVWLTFTAQIFVSEFFNYHGPRGWLNQPLVQVPWFRYVPAHLQQAAQEETRADPEGAAGSSGSNRSQIRTRGVACPGVSTRVRKMDPPRDGSAVLSALVM